ncbi:YlxR family protein [Allosalinactinospora lopnorensis]|uniref:YlxR family protein n=1 Tax=Allosalinactinospora lopnorensis TaxID=1352348 RepID=UPI0012E1BE73|nr:YlxR family protein [Allosalinactinospora lopnorensis]
MDASGRPSPVRTCVGCRSRAAQSDLLRLVADTVSASVVVDPARRMPGRGAYLHADRRCWEKAERRRAWQRVFRAANGFDTSRVAAYFAADPHVGVGRGSR